MHIRKAAPSVESGWYTHTFQPGTAANLEYQHTYGGARTDVQGIGWLGMDWHTVEDVASGSSVSTSYDHVSKADSSIYPSKGYPSDVVAVYNRTNNGTLTTETKGTHTDCSFVVSNGGIHVARQSCDETQYEQEYQNDTCNDKNPIPCKKKLKRIHTDYNPDYGYVTDRTTAIGMGTTLTDPMNETTLLTRSGFSTDNADKWISGHADQETVVSTMPARTEPSTPTLSTTRTTKFNYDTGTGALNWIEADPDGQFLRKTAYSRNAQGQVTTTTVSTSDGHQRVTTIGFAATGDLFPSSSTSSGVSSNCPTGSAVSAECAAPQTVTLKYHSGLGLLMETTDPNGVPSVSQFDGFGRLRVEQRATGSIVTRQHGVDTSVPYDVLIDDGGKIRREQFDQRHLLTSTKELDQTGTWFSVTDIQRDPYGRVTNQTRPDGVSATSFTYDSMGRLTSEIGPLAGQQATWTYSFLTTTRTNKGATSDANGSSIDQVDVTVHDEADRVISRTEKVGAMSTSPGGTAGSSHDIITKYVYGPFDAVRDIVDTNGNTIHNDYDTAGRRWQVKDPDAGNRTYHFNGFDQITSSSADGKTQQWDYDVLGRKIHETTSEGTSQFNWDTAPNGIGKPSSTTSMLDGVADAYEYDQQGLLSGQTRRVDGQSYRIDIGHDDLGRTNSIMYPVAAGSRYSVKYTYDGNSGELQGIADGAGNSIWHVDTRNHYDLVSQATYGNGAIASRSYYPQLQTPLLQGVSVSGPQGVEQVLGLGFSYDSRGYLTGRTDYLTNETEQFTHDELGRLTNWSGTSGGGWSVNYTYDDIGNLVSKAKLTASGHISSRSYVPGDGTGNSGGPHGVKLVQYYEGDSGGGQWGILNHYQYDGAGRQYQSDDRALTYTDFDLPRQIQEASTTWNFQYDANRQRAKKSDSQNRSTVYFGKLYEKRTSSSGAVSHVMYVGADRREVVAQVTQADEGGQPTVDYLFADQLGSMAAITSSTDTVQSSAQIRFDPFGARIDTSAPPSSGTNPRPRVTLGYTGQEEDEDGLALLNLGGRMYDPDIMRFLTADPYVTRPLYSQELNRYSYARNSPFRYTDRSGMQTTGNEEPPPNPPVTPTTPPDGGGGPPGPTGGYQGGSSVPNQGDNEGDNQAGGQCVNQNSSNPGDQFNGGPGNGTNAGDQQGEQISSGATTGETGVPEVGVGPSGVAGAGSSSSHPVNVGEGQDDKGEKSEAAEKASTTAGVLGVAMAKTEAAARALEPLAEEGSAEALTLSRGAAVLSYGGYGVAFVGLASDAYLAGQGSQAGQINTGLGLGTLAASLMAETEGSAVGIVIVGGIVMLFVDQVVK